MALIMDTSQIMDASAGEATLTDEEFDTLCAILAEWFKYCMEDDVDDY